MPKGPDFSGKTILIVDDDESIQDYVKTILEGEGFQTLTASNGEEGFLLAGARNPDLILIDAEMPVMTGFEAISKIRSDPKIRMTPVILVTALKKTEDRIRGIEAGCDNFLTKPFDTQELLAEIRKLLTMNYYRALLDEKEKFEYVLNHMNSGMLVLDAEMHVSQINKKAQELLHVGEALQKKFNLVGHLRDHFQVHYDGDLLSDIKSKAVSFELVRQETEKFQQLVLSVTSSFIRNPAGELNSVVMILLDVTDQKKNDFLKVSFLDFVSHKLFTPLTSIHASLSLMQDGERSDDLVKLCSRQFNELAGRIRNILSYCKVLRGDTGLPVEKISLSEHLAAQIETYLQTKNGHPIHYEVVCPDRDLSLNIEREYFDLMMRNLVDNAVEHNDQESIHVRIEAAPHGNQAVISIHDNGRGIPPEEFERIFDNFYQIDKGSTGNLKGVGLGLAIVKHLVARHGGTIRVDSKIKSGSCFVLSLPLNPSPILPGAGESSRSSTPSS